MTEEDWLKATRPEDLLNFLEKRRQLDKRKARLLGAADCRRIWHILVDDRLRRAVDLAELRADGLVPWRDVEAHIPLARQACPDGNSHIAPAECAALATTRRKIRPGWIAWLTRHAVVREQTEPDREAVPQLGLLYDIFVNPFRPVAFDARWRTSDSIGVAAAIYESRTFVDMPILGDALEDAGCDHADVLAHCRSESGAHARGCWVVDLVLSKT